MTNEILELYENKFMFKQAMRLAKDVDRAHDLVQDTMIRLMDNANKYTASQGGWASSIGG
jgi:DNA-directed RNA polymerase specialized sigma24 family protein